MNVLAERLERAFTALDLTPHKFDKKHEGKGVSRATLFNALKPENSPRFDTIAIICDLEPSISAEYLLRGIGEPLKPDYAIGDTDPCAKYKDHIARQSRQNSYILTGEGSPLL